MRLFILLFSLVFALTVQAEIKSFGQAKTALKNHVYYDTMDDGDFYCGCKWEWKGATGGRVDHESCGYKTRKNEVRANRTEWEHVVPGWVIGHQRQCWQDGGRKNCTRNDPAYKKMEGDPHNLHISVGEVNADRSNYRMAMLPSTHYQHGACDFKVNFKQRSVEPRDEVKGQIARIYFYMHDRYNLNMSKQQQKLFMAWDKMFPPKRAELIRDKRIAKIAGNNNPFVTGEKKWHLGFKTSGEGLKGISSPYNKTQARVTNSTPKQQNKAVMSVKGNINSKIYHLPHCGSYNRMAERNARYFNSEEEAVRAGFRKARSCN